MEQIIIGVDPHKLSATIEVLDEHEKRLCAGRFTTDKAGYAAMLTYAKAWPHRRWAVEGAKGAGRPLAQRLLQAGEDVVDVPAKLAARVQLFVDRREALTRRRVQTVNRLQALLAELPPGQGKKDITTGQAKALLASVRPRDIPGKTCRRIAAEELAELVTVEAKIKKATAELKVLVLARGCRLISSRCRPRRGCEGPGRRWGRHPLR